MCEECGYSLLHRLGCPQITDTDTRRCRICDGAVYPEDLAVTLRQGKRLAHVCYTCAEEMDLYDIKELFGLTETVELIARLAASTDGAVTVGIIEN